MKHKSTFIFPQGVEGWFSKDEGKLLYKLAQKNKELGCVVELGSYCGRSTICLAQGVRDYNGGKVYAVDNYKGDIFTGLSGDFLEIFNKNIKNYGLEKWVDPIKGEFSEIVKTWKKPIRLLFIDGSHNYNSVLEDFNTWSKRVVPGGIIAFHDSLLWRGVVKVIKEAILLGEYKNIKTLNSLAGITYMTKKEKEEKLEYEKLHKYYKDFIGKTEKMRLFRAWMGVKELLFSIIRAHKYF